MAAGGLSGRGAQAQLLHGKWNLPRPGIEPGSPALAGGFLFTVPPGTSGIFPDLGSNLGLLHWQVGSCPLYPF